MEIRRYSELIKLPTYEERFGYLQLNGVVGEDKFGFTRIFNQQFYHSRVWKDLRDEIICRDGGCDLGVPGYDIFGEIVVHHMNPITLDDIERKSDYLLNPEFLICAEYLTHQAIHYGNEEHLIKMPKERTKYDTCPWRL